MSSYVLNLTYYILLDFPDFFETTFFFVRSSQGKLNFSTENLCFVREVREKLFIKDIQCEFFLSGNYFSTGKVRGNLLGKVSENLLGKVSENILGKNCFFYHMKPAFVNENFVLSGKVSENCNFRQGKSRKTFLVRENFFIKESH